MIYLLLLILLLQIVVICQRGIKLSTLKQVRCLVSELSDAVAAIADDVTELQTAGQRVIDLLTQPNPDVAAAVEALKAADAGFDALRDSLNAAGQPPVV